MTDFEAVDLLPLEIWPSSFSHILKFSLSSLMNPSTPPTSPQWAQAAAPQPLLQNAPQINIPQMLGNLNHGPIPMQRFPGLPRNVVEHHEAQCMWCQYLPPPAPALAPPFGHIPAPVPAAPALQNKYERHMANVAAATMNNFEAHLAARRRHNNPQQPQPQLQPQPAPAPAPAPAPPAPPIYGPIHYEGAVGPDNFDNPLHYFAPNPPPPLPAPPGPDYNQFNIQFHHHFQEEQMEDEWVRNDLLHRQEQEALHQQQIQEQLQQQEAEQINREAQHDLE
ncbi:hypothetical protein EDB19DRAFT_1917673 [Suillus lakei]|nr:hypothetical protein EDB19DRAFT_1917673 [Suillus lakei]